MHKRPLAVIVIFFIIGILLGEFFQSYITLIQVFCAFLFFLFFTITFTFTRKIWVSYIFLFLSIISVGALLYLNSNIFPPNHVSHFLGKDKVKAEIIGVIKSPAEARGIYYGKISSRYIFEIESIDNLKINGLALIRIQTEKDYQYGDRLLVKGSIRNPKFEIRNPKQIQNPKSQKSNFNYTKYLENQDIFAIIDASEKNVALLSYNYKSNPIIRYAYLIREKIKNQFLENMPLESGAFMRAILLGDRSELPKRLNESFRNSGTMHILPTQCRAMYIYPS